ncbi:tRNA (adenosine(37)-N6)-threonylcarbamoyltransferase complex ATPase subunit type 1 TsaE [Thermovibrio sp.]
MSKCTFKTKSERETLLLGELLSKLLPKGTFVVLKGNLGCGKTVLTKGIARGLGVREEEVSSPSFNIVHEHENLIHVDFYRLNSLEEVYDLGFDEILEDERVKVAEWGELVVELLKEPIVIECREFNGEREFTVYDPKGKICQQLTNLWREHVKNSGR